MRFLFVPTDITCGAFYFAKYHHRTLWLFKYTHMTHFLDHFVTSCVSVIASRNIHTYAILPGEYHRVFRFLDVGVRSTIPVAVEDIQQSNGHVGQWQWKQIMQNKNGYGRWSMWTIMYEMGASMLYAAIETHRIKFCEVLK